MLRSLTAVLTFTLALSACASPEPSGNGVPEPRETPTIPAEPSMSESEMTRRAEAAAKNSLPDAPIWEGMKFKGSVIDDSTVCVDRTWARNGGLDGKGGNAGYVVVTFPDESLGEPQDGVCADVAGSAEPDAAPPVQVPDDVKGEPGLVTRDDLGTEWPLTVDYAILACEPKTAGGMDLQIATLTAPDGTVYALNGTAKDHTDYADLAPIWADDPDVEGLKINIGPLIDQARALC